MKEEILTITTEFRCPKPECGRFDGSAIIERTIHTSDTMPDIPKCKKCGGQMVEIRCWAEPFQRNFD
jgi:hypothetical protein